MKKARSQGALVALKPFVFRGSMLAQGDEFTPDDPAQSELLALLGFAATKRRSYRNRAIPAAQSAAVIDATERAAMADSAERVDG